MLPVIIIGLIGSRFLILLGAILVIFVTTITSSPGFVVIDITATMISVLIAWKMASSEIDTKIANSISAAIKSMQSVLKFFSSLYVLAIITPLALMLLSGLGVPIDDIVRYVGFNKPKEVTFLSHTIKYIGKNNNHIGVISFLDSHNIEKTVESTTADDCSDEIDKQSISRGDKVFIIIHGSGKCTVTKNQSTS
ncbi:hypothetical protein HQ393_10040 [Chitinibacter bivalviorum]|uniref:Uncharacterized protein n=1 Tax=Chitinibacter bivalviorum TaxID=2739434 RepID=A0A7H9BMF5_9NEIS|nr:hypothetical protein [Chitinibacter bivalviorum]QLG88554.1 hypothetical protein HQ393_10040 [Chitinibacter bivalviorum]